MQTLIRRSSAYFSTARHCLHTSTAPLIRETGLYGFDHLKTPRGFQRMVDDAIERSNELVSYIAGMPSGPEIIKAMDEISNAVCTVIDSAELCRCTHPDREFAEEASKASLRINEYLHYLNSNCTLYHAVIKAEQDHHLLTEEAQRAARYLRIDMEKGGIHLTSEKLNRVNQLNIDIIRLSREFNENIITDPGHVDIFPASRIPKQLHHLAKPIYHPSGALSMDGNEKEKGYRLVTEPDALCSILQFASDAEVRKLAYVRGNSVPQANLVVLDKLIAARHEFAENHDLNVILNILSRDHWHPHATFHESVAIRCMKRIVGYKSYAEFALKGNMASSPEVVLSFLLDMSQMVRPKAEEELKNILDFKRERSGQLHEGLEPWDEAYFTRLMKSSAHNLNYPGRHRIIANEAITFVSLALDTSETVKGPSVNKAKSSARRRKF